MATSLYFNNFGASNEQGLINDLIVESIKIYGNDVYYCPRTINNYDPIYGADTISTYESHYFVEMYIKSVDGFEGDGIFLSKFGLEIRDQVTFTVAKKTFDEEVGLYTDHPHPEEGDLIYFELNPERHQLYQVKYVNDRSIFYQFGGFQVFDLVCEVFEYSNERMSTGIEEIDAIQTNYSIDMQSFTLSDQAGDTLTTQDGSDLTGVTWGGAVQTYMEDNDDLQTEATVDDVIDWAEIDPFSEGRV